MVQRYKIFTSCADIQIKNRKADKFAKKRTLWED
nr:MAG TPA: hypothetical protein [Caudoviricetes sp.]